MIGQSNVLDILTQKHIDVLPTVFFQFHLKRSGAWTCKLGEELNANNDT